MKNDSYLQSTNTIKEENLVDVSNLNADDIK